MAQQLRQNFSSYRESEFGYQHPHGLAIAFDYRSRGYDTLFWPPHILYSCAYSYTQRQTYMHMIKVKTKLKHDKIKL